MVLLNVTVSAFYNHCISISLCAIPTSVMLPQVTLLLPLLWHYLIISVQQHVMNLGS